VMEGDRLDISSIVVVEIQSPFLQPFRLSPFRLSDWLSNNFVLSPSHKMAELIHDERFIPERVRNDPLAAVKTYSAQPRLEYR
jgi:hypothetical protein